MKIFLNVYANGKLVYSQEANSPVENYGKLHAKWLEASFSYGLGHSITVSLTDYTGTADTLSFDAIYTVNLEDSRFIFTLIDDATPPPFTRNMYSPKDTDSTLYEIMDNLAGYYVDSNSNLVIFIQSEVYTPTTNQTIEAISLSLWYDVVSNTDTVKYLLFYDLLANPLSLTAGVSYQFEYQIVYP